MDLNIPHTFTQYQIDCFLSNAFDSGIYYWCDAIKIIEEPTEKAEYTSDVISRGGVLSLRVADDFERKWYRFGQEELEQGFILMARDYPQHFADLISENDDAITADVLVQLAVLGELIYG